MSDISDAEYIAQLENAIANMIPVYDRFCFLAHKTLEDAKIPPRALRNSRYMSRAWPALFKTVIPDLTTH